MGTVSSHERTEGFPLRPSGSIDKMDDSFAPVSSEGIEINPGFAKALDIMENSNRHLLITGKAGTGKSTLLDYFRRNSRKNVVVLAPTGVAALNVSGETIHSFFGFKPDITHDKVRKNRRFGTDGNSIYRMIDTIVIDEISMVRSDLLDCVDKSLRLNRGYRATPFGGVQMIFIGDLFQLPPVVTTAEKKIYREYYSSEYFFSAHVFTEIEMEYVELEKVYRQEEEDFIRILNAIRNNTAGPEELDRLNSRFKPTADYSDEYTIHLTTTNAMANTINAGKLSELPGDGLSLSGEIDGNFDTRNLPTEQNLFLKEKAQVMCLNNDSEGRWVNGSLGRVLGFNGESVVVEFPNGKFHEVLPFTWELFHFQWDTEENKIISDLVGKFKQYPLRLAWAVTIHKSQGKSFDKVIIDLGWGSFAPGQTYVALSRCRRLDGIVLKQKILPRHIMVDPRVIRFIDECNKGSLKRGFLFSIQD